MKMNLSKVWLRQRAALDDKAEVSAGTLDLDRLPAVRPSNVISMQAAAEAESPNPAFGRLINLWRRKKGFRIEVLADNARIDVSELIEIERNLNFVPEPRTVYQLAKTLDLPSERMLELTSCCATPVWAKRQSDSLLVPNQLKNYRRMNRWH